MLAQQKKWWRWIGEPSEAGGLIGRYEGGLYFDKCVWRPSQHSIMKTLGYYYDQVSREVMTQRISSRVKLVDASTPTTGQVGNTDTLWLDTQHPVDHELNVTWSLDGTVVAEPRQPAHAEARRPGADAPARHTVTAKVSDPTTFVRDPAIQNGTALTQTLTWTVKDGANAPGAAEPATITGGTQNERAGRPQRRRLRRHQPPGRRQRPGDHLEARRHHACRNASDGRFINLAEPQPDRHAHADGDAPATSTRTWDVDATDAVTTYTTSTPEGGRQPAGRRDPRVHLRGPVLAQARRHRRQAGLRRARVPRRRRRLAATTTAGRPTPTRRSSSPTPAPTSTCSTTASSTTASHVIEYRAIDAAGNIATAKKFALTYLDPEKSEVAPVGGTVPATLVAEPRRHAAHVRRVHARPHEGLHGEHGRRRGLDAPATPR